MAVIPWLFFWSALIVSVTAKWGPWGPFSPCTRTCDGGSKTRSRMCPKGQSCGPIQDGIDIQPCDTPKCCIREPFVGPWGKWNDCPVTCSTGVQFRVRRCDISLCPKGPFCTEKMMQTRICDEGCCPKDSEWGPWNKWGACSVTCGKGVRYRERKCQQDPCPKSPQGCPGEFEESEPCDEGCCPDPPKWRPWGKWSKCSKTCGGGKKTRQRKCQLDNKCKNKGKPKPKCQGPRKETVPCNVECCEPSVWEGWSDWGECSVTCGGGNSTRSRICHQPCSNSEPCLGDSEEYRSCNEQCCHRSKWSKWSRWSSCSQSCGGGISTRVRECRMPCENSKPCKGNSVKEKSCNTQCCPMPSQWGPWSKWGECCEKTKKRSRECIPDEVCPITGSKCPGSSMETTRCLKRTKCSTSD